MLGGKGECPGWDHYEGERAGREEKGEMWPSASTLSRLYFGWPGAVRAAARWLYQGSVARVPSSYRRRYTERYSPEEVLAAIRRCARKQRSWPTKSEFAAFCETERFIAKRQHKPPPRAPVLKTVRRLFDTYENALTKAKASVVA